MPTSRRSFITATGAACLASLASSVPARAQEYPDIGQAVAELVRRSADANARLLTGDIDAYRSLIMLADDFTLMSPFGGMPTRGADVTEESWAAMGRFFSNGTLKQELVQAYSVADMVVLVLLERGHGEVGGLPAQDWPLRVTLVYRRDGSEWRLAHRHADPLVNGITLEQAAALADFRSVSKGQQDMTPAEKAARAVLAAWDSGNFEAIRDLVTPGFVDHGAPPGMARPGPDGYIATLRMVTELMDLRYELHEVVAAGDLVAVRATAHGVDKSGHLGLPPTGKPFAMPTMHLYRAEGDRLAEHWGVRDELSVLWQVGALARPTAPDIAVNEGNR